MKQENSYSQKINEQIQSVYTKGIATKIMQHMDRIRNVSDISQTRRWVMELLQNAQDVSYPDQKVRMKITLTDDSLKVAHNGKPFSVNNILSIINQVSSKNPDEESIGKFGTGFVTTFQLSEIVQIDSILQEPGLDNKPFSISINRTGQTEQEILDAIFDSMKELRKADTEASPEHFDKNDFNTCFTYNLSGEESKKAALTGMEDLQHSVFYILLFSGKLSEVILEYKMTDRNETVSYRLLGDDSLWSGSLLEAASEEDSAENCLRQMNFVTTRYSGNTREQFPTSLVYMSEGDVTLAAKWRKDEGFLPCDEKTPRLFVTFPLIGAENFPFPMVIGCNGFKVNESRSGITLVDNAASKDAPVNKEYMSQAVRMYKSFLEQAVSMERNGIRNLISIPVWKENNEMSEEWVRENIYQALYNSLKQVPLFDTYKAEGRLEVPGVCLIHEDDPAKRKELAGLLHMIPAVYVPVDNEDWYHAMENYPVETDKVWSLEKMLSQCEALFAKVKNAPDDTANVENTSGNTANIENALKETANKSENRKLAWLLKLTKLGLSDPEAKTRILVGDVAIFPNQEDWKDNKLHKINELRTDPGIPEIIKDITEQLDRLIPPAGGEALLHLRRALLHPDFAEIENIQMDPYEAAKAERYIAGKSNRAYRVWNYNAYSAAYNDAWSRSWKMLLSCGPDKEMYELAMPFYGELPPYSPCTDNWNESMWYSCYKSVLDQITDWCMNCRTLKNLTYNYFNEDEDKAIDWLNRLIPKAKARFIEINTKAVFPNQEGCLTAIQWILRDETPDDSLKEIAYVFQKEASECNFYRKVLDRRLEAELLCPGKLSESEVAMMLNNTLQQILSRHQLTDTPMEYQSACGSLLAWIEDHPDLSMNYFPNFASEQDKVKLMTPAVVVELKRGNRLAQQLLRNAGVENMEDLEKKYIEYKQKADMYDSMSRIRDNSNGLYWNPDEDVYYGPELMDFEDDEREATIRKIGCGGERYALEKIKQYCIENGARLLEESENRIVLNDPDDENAQEIVLTYGDKGNHHQAGWDIRADVSGQTYYIEVKTHTLTSKAFGLLPLTTEQMRLACKEREHFIALHVAYDWKEDCGINVRAFKDPLGCFGRRELDCNAHEYIFQIAG